MKTLEKEIKKSKKNDSIRTEILLRDTSNHYIRLIGDSDRKARIMIVVNSILLTGGVTVITKVIHHQPLVWISAAILIFANLMAFFLPLCPSSRTCRTISVTKLRIVCCIIKNARSSALPSTQNIC